MLNPGHPTPEYLAELSERISQDPDCEDAKQLRWFAKDGTDEESALLTLARSRLGLCDPDSLVVLRSNPSFYLLWDARHLCALATLAHRRREGWVEPALARSSFLLTCAGLDSFINAVYENSEAPDIERFVRLPPREKWLKAPHACLPHGGRLWSNRQLVFTPGDPIATFDSKAEPFASFSELWTVRNALVHSHAGRQVVTIDQANAPAGMPETYPLTRLPKEVHDWRAEHARKALRIAWAMIRSLDQFFKGSLNMLRLGANTAEVVL